MEIKGVQELTDFLQHWLKSHHFNYAVDLDTDFYCDYDKDSIAYAITESEDQIRCYKEYCKQRGFGEDLQYFTLAFLHEIGHLEDNDTLDDEDIKFSQTEKERLGSLENNDTTKFAYYDLPTEWSATTWALYYTKVAPKIVRRLDNKISQLLQNIYTLNGITE